MKKFYEEICGCVDFGAWKNFEPPPPLHISSGTYKYSELSPLYRFWLAIQPLELGKIEPTQAPGFRQAKRGVSRLILLSPYIMAPGLTKIPSFPLLYRLWDLEKILCSPLFIASGTRKKRAYVGFGIWMSIAPSEARCESSYIAFSLYNGPRTYKNSELYPSIQALGLGKIPCSSLSEVLVGKTWNIIFILWFGQQSDQKSPKRRRLVF